MADVAKGTVLLTPKFDNLTSSIQSQLDSAFSSSSAIGSKAGASMGQSFTKGISAKLGAIAGIASNVASSAFSAVTSSISTAVDRVDTMANFPKVMKNLGYSTESATAAIQKMSASIDGMPTSLPALTSMVQQLAPLTGSLESATDIGIAFNNMCLASGASTSDVSRALQQYTQILSKGVPELQDWKTLQEVMPGQLNQVAQAMLGAGSSSTDLYNALKGGTVTMDDFNAAVLSLNENGIDGFASFAQQAKDSTQGIGTAVENVKNRIAKATQVIVESIGQENISGLINNITSQFVPMAQKVADGLSAIIDKAGGFDQFVSILGKVGGTVLGVSTAASALSSLDGALGAVGGLSGAFGTLVSKAGDAKAGLSLAAEVIGNAWTGVPGKVGAVFKQVFSTVGTAGKTFLMLIGQTFSPITEYFGGLLKTALTPLATLVKDFGTTFKEAFTGIFSGLGEVILPHLTSVKDKVTGVLSTVGGAIKGVMSPILSFIGQALTPLKEAITGVFGGIFKTASGLLGLVNPVTVVAGVIAALAAGFVYMFATNEDFRNSVAQALGQIQEAFLPVLWQLQPIFEQLKAYLQQAFDYVVSTVLPALGNMALGFIELLARLSPFVAAVISSLIPVFEAVWPLIEQVAGILMDVLGAAFTAIQGVVETVWPLIEQIVTSTLTVISDTLNNVSPLIRDIVQTTMSAIQSVIQIVTGVISGDWSQVWEGIKSLLSTVWNGMGRIVEQATGTVKGIIDSALGAIKGIWQSAWDLLGSLLNSAWNGIVSAVSGGNEDVMAVLGDLPGRITGFFSDAGSWLLDSGRALMDGFADGIRGAISSVVSTVSGAVSKVREYFPFSPAKKGAFSGHGYTTYSGKALMGGLGEGIEGAVPSVVSTTADALSSVRDALTSDELVFSASATASKYASAYDTLAAQLEVSGDGDGMAIDRVIELLAAILGKDSNTYLDGEKVSSALAARTRYAMAGRGLA